jgi:beta-lactamase regulating signal transducer with metallopeptidase domain
MTVLPALLEAVLKATLLLAAAGLVVFALRNATASLRHFVWSCSLVGALAIPALTLVLPTWQLGIVSAPGARVLSDPFAPTDAPTVADPAIDAKDVAVTVAATDVPTSLVPSQSPVTAPQQDWTTIFVWLWLGGIAVGLITLVGGLATLRRIARRSRELTDASWTGLVKEIAVTLGIERPVRAIIGNTASMPATWGFFRPTVLLPADAENWDDERRRVVLLHELAHVRRNDCLMQIVAQFCCTVYWFHPAVWYAAARLRSERELACDEHVLGLGVNACDYAAHLLEIATRFRAPAHTSIAAVSMARQSQLEGRLTAILSGRVTPRITSSARVRASAFVALVAFTLPLAAMRPWKTAEIAEISAPAEQTDALAAPASLAEEKTVAPVDTFRWKGVVPAGRWVEVMARYSDVRVELSPSSSTEIIAVHRSGGRGSYRVAMENPDGGARFCVVAAATPNSPVPCQSDRAVLRNGVPDTRVDFLVRLPAGVGISVHTGRGNVTADGVQSYVWGTSGRGDIRIVTTDLAEANAGAGSIYAEFRRRSWRQNLEFLADQGDITVIAPSDANMMIEVETSAGQVTSDFGGTPTRFASGQQIMTRTGQNGGMLTIRTGRGRVELKRGPTAVAELSSIQLSRNNAPLTVDPLPNPNPAGGVGEGEGSGRGSGSNYNPNPNLGGAGNPDSDYNTNPDPPDDADENTPESDGADRQRNEETGERLPVTIPAGLVDRFSDAAIRNYPDARPIARLRDIAATHVKKHPNDYVRERSEWALTLVKNGEVVVPLRAALSNPDWRVRAYAAWALGVTQDSRATDALTTALGDPHWRVRMHAAASLERTGAGRSVLPLISALDDEHWQVRIAAVDALAASGDARARGALQRVAERDAREMVRDGARGALGRIR